MANLRIIPGDRTGAQKPVDAATLEARKRGVRLGAWINELLLRSHLRSSTGLTHPHFIEKRDPATLAGIDAAAMELKKIFQETKPVDAELATVRVRLDKIFKED